MPRARRYSACRAPGVEAVATNVIEPWFTGRVFGTDRNRREVVRPIAGRMPERDRLAGPGPAAGVPCAPRHGMPGLGYNECRNFSRKSPMTIEHRRHPRFESDLPVAVSFGEVLASESSYLSNISAGGVAFNAMVELAPGTVIMLQLPPGRPVLSTPVQVVWCRKMALHYVIGAEFLSKDLAFRERIVEMVRRIDGYRVEAERAGRNLSAQQAALEWIGLFGKDFFSLA